MQSDRKNEVRPQNGKRRAEDTLTPDNDKVSKMNKTGGPSAGVSPMIGSRPVPGSVKATTNARPSGQAVPFRGTGRPKATSAIPPAPQPNVLQEEALKADASTDAAKQPKKGSYKDIMARAQASQAKTSAIGAISHKPKEKTALSYKKQLELEKKEKRNRKLGIKSESRASSSEGQNGKHAAGPTNGTPMRPINEKRAPQPSYQGTMKPKPQPNYKGTMHSASTDSKKTAMGFGAPKCRTNEYAATDDELDEEGEEDEEESYGYSEEESDDMEAGFSDVEQEESTAARAARKEDEEEARLEAKLKCEKEARRRKLEQMAQRAKPQRY